MPPKKVKGHYHIINEEDQSHSGWVLGTRPNNLDAIIYTVY